MFLKIVGLLLLVIAASARHMRMKMTAKSQRQSDEGVVYYQRENFCRVVCGFCDNSEAAPHPVKRLCSSQCREGEGPSYDTCFALFNRRTTTTTAATTDRTGDPLVAKPKIRPDWYDRTEWGAMTMCPGYSFARAFRQYQNIPQQLPVELPLKVHPLEQIEFNCRMPYYGTFCDGQNCGWRKSGLPESVNWGNSGLLECPHPKQFLTGIQVAFGSYYEGAWNMTVICDVPNWDSTPEKKAGEDKPQAVKLGPRRGMESPLDPPSNGPSMEEELRELGKAQKARKAHQADDNDSHATGHREERNLRMRDAPRGYEDELKCDPGKAICGFSTKTQDTDLDVGIMEIKALCCPFPAWTSD